MTATWLRPLFGLALAAALLPVAAQGSSLPQTAPPIEPEVCFTPGGRCTDLIVSKIEGAKLHILMQAYSFTSTPIAEALVRATQRGVRVQAILDKSQRTERYSGATFLANAGIPVLIDEKPAIAHNKVMIIDGQLVITGSFNFTKAAQEKNAENVVVLTDPSYARRFTANWHSREAASVPYVPPSATAPSSKRKQ